MTILQDDNGMVLMVNHFDNTLDGFDFPGKLDNMHIGFIQESCEAVDAMFARLSNDGWQTQKRHGVHGTWSFYSRAKGGYFVNVTTLTLIRPVEAYHGNRK